MNEQISEALVTAICKACTDEKTPQPRLASLMSTYNKMFLDHDRRQFHTAMKAVQMELTQVVADGANPATRSRYATLSALDAAVRASYTAWGLTVHFDSFDAVDANGNHQLTVECVVSYGDYSTSSSVTLPVGGTKSAANPVQLVGSALTYGRRYTLAMAFNLTVGEDNDANHFVPPISQQQVEMLTQAWSPSWDPTKLFEREDITAWSQLPRDRFGAVMSEISTKRERARAKAGKAKEETEDA